MLATLRSGEPGVDLVRYVRWTLDVQRRAVESITSRKGCLKYGLYTQLNRPPQPRRCEMGFFKLYTRMFFRNDSADDGEDRDGGI